MKILCLASTFLALLMPNDAVAASTPTESVDGAFEFGRKAGNRGASRVRGLLETETIFRELLDEDVMMYSMSMSMSMSMPNPAPALPAPKGQVPAIEDDESMPSSPPVTLALPLPEEESTAVEEELAEGVGDPSAATPRAALTADGSTPAGSPATTSVVAVASAGAVLVAALAIRRSRKQAGYEDLDAKDDGNSFAETLPITVTGHSMSI